MREGVGRELLHLPTFRWSLLIGNERLGIPVASLLLW
jgi:hypothetical protein